MPVCASIGHEGTEAPSIASRFMERIGGESFARGIFCAVREPTANGQYVHWDKLRHLEPPAGLDRRAWWSQHDVVYETARSDLLELVARGLMRKRKRGRRWVFTPEPDLERKLKDAD